MSCQDSGAQRFIGNSLKLRVGSVFVNGKMTVSLLLGFQLKLLGF